MWENVCVTKHANPKDTEDWNIKIKKFALMK